MALYDFLTFSALCAGIPTLHEGTNNAPDSPQPQLPTSTEPIDGVPYCGRHTSSALGQFSLGFIPPNYNANAGWDTLPLADRDDLPQQVDFRDNEESFNELYEMVLRDGRLYTRHRHHDNADSTNATDSAATNPWRIVPTPPELDGAITSMSLSGDNLAVTDANNWVYTMFNTLSGAPNWTWVRAWGAPFWFGKGTQVPDTRNGRWALGLIDNNVDKTYHTPDGYQYPISVFKCTMIVSLSLDGSRIYDMDAWFPVLDYSYEQGSPHNCRFISRTMSVAGNVTMIMNDYGDIFVRLWDFDCSGADTAQFRYTWTKQSPGMPQASNFIKARFNPKYPAIMLPPTDWAQQPKVPGDITDRISLVTTGPNSINREMRVEGTKDGRTGYWKRPVHWHSAPWTQDSDGRPHPAAGAYAEWEFVPTDMPLRGTPITNPQEDTSSKELAPASPYDYWGELMPGVELIVNDFAYAANSRTSILRVNGTDYDIQFHTIDGRLAFPLGMRLSNSRWQPVRAFHDAGLNWKKARFYAAAIELTEEQCADPALSSFIKTYMKGEKLREVFLAVTTDKMVIVNSPSTRVCVATPANTVMLRGMDSSRKAVHNRTFPGIPR